MKPRYWSLAIVLVLVNYIIFATLFTILMEYDFGGAYVTRTPVPTFTPAPAEPIIIVPTPIPTTPEPTATATRVVGAEGNAAPDIPSYDGVIQAKSIQPEFDQGRNLPQLAAPGPVNIRFGPGLSYDVIGTLNPDTTMTITGRNVDASWWQIKIANDRKGWVANAVVQVRNTKGIPLAEAPPRPKLVEQEIVTVSNPLPVPEKPRYQFEPTGWYDDGNAGLTRFLGDIKDVDGNPVNGVFVQAKCGDFTSISNPSGPIGWGRYNESADWPPGFYDITVDTKPVPCVWVLTVVDTDDRKRVKAVLSESIPVQITSDKSIVTANWRKNW